MKNPEKEVVEEGSLVAATSIGYWEIFRDFVTFQFLQPTYDAPCGVEQVSKLFLNDSPPRLHLPVRHLLHLSGCHGLRKPLGVRLGSEQFQH